jgi:hypothetical protein
MLLIVNRHLVLNQLHDIIDLFFLIASSPLFISLSLLSSFCDLSFFLRVALRFVLLMSLLFFLSLFFGLSCSFLFCRSVWLQLLPLLCLYFTLTHCSLALR